jgi:hypothetical protein
MHIRFRIFSTRVPTADSLRDREVEDSTLSPDSLRMRTPAKVFLSGFRSGTYHGGSETTLSRALGSELSLGGYFGS